MGSLHEASFEPSDESVAAARGLTRAALSEWGLDPDDVLIAVSELASNAIRHAGTGYTVAIELVGASVRVTVTDSYPQQRPSKSRTVRNGRGLEIVDRLAADWGVRPEGPGKAYWAVFNPSAIA